jgi:hypothetical protein
MNEERFKAIYRSHLESLIDFRNHSQLQQGGNLLEQIQRDLLKEARYVSPSVYRGHTLTTTPEAYTRVPHPIL